MHAVIRTGGKQYRVAAGDTLEVEKLDGNVGDGYHRDIALERTPGLTCIKADVQPTLRSGKENIWRTGVLTDGPSEDQPTYLHSNV